jgi:lysozyme
MNVEKISAMLVREEGERLSAYQDHLGYWTIGVGRLIDERRGGGISRAESRILLANDIRAKGIAAESYPWFAGLDEARQAVVVGMIFQMGAAGFAGFRNTIARIEAGDYTEAAAGMLRSKWARQTPERAGRMAEIMRTGEWPYP